MDEGWRPSDADGAADRRAGGVPKLTGIDCELGILMPCVDEEADTGRLASGALLAEIVGLPAGPPGDQSPQDPQDLDLTSVDPAPRRLATHHYHCGADHG